MNPRLALAIRRMGATAALLPTLGTGLEIEQHAARMLSDLIRCDRVLLTSVDLGGSDTSVRSGLDLRPDRTFSQALSMVAHRHPAIVSYLRPGDDRRPRRVSDVTSARGWISSDVYNEVFREREARFQLSLVTHLRGTTGAGWVLGRASRDFSDSDVEVAALALPLLTAMKEVAAARPSSLGESQGLTEREEAVLRLLASGLAASAIARLLHVQESTVRKHLQHIYAKLGAPDRLSAVIRASQLGYVAPLGPLGEHGPSLDGH